MPSAKGKKPCQQGKRHVRPQLRGYPERFPLGPLSLWERVRVRVFAGEFGFRVSVVSPASPYPNPFPEGEGAFRIASKNEKHRGGYQIRNGWADAGYPGPFVELAGKLRPCD